jgi:hypothetical protein
MQKMRIRSLKVSGEVLEIDFEVQTRQFLDLIIGSLISDGTNNQ